MRKYFVEPHILRFADHKRWKGKTVLEIGCGIGTDAEQFALAGAEVTALDLSRKSLEICLERFRINRQNGLFYRGNIEDTDVVPVQFYDLVYAFGVLHHTPDPVRSIENIKRYMGPHSELRIMLYSKWSWKSIAIGLRHCWWCPWHWRKAVENYSEAATGCPVTHLHSFADIRLLLKDFEIVRMWKDHIFPYSIDHYRQYEYLKVWYFRWCPRWLFKKLESVLGWHTLVIAKLKENHVAH
jgi:SAM-dependent methyltransferase